MSTTARVLSRLHLHWIGDARASATLGHRRADRVRLGLFHARVALAALPKVPPPKPARARLRPDGHEVELAGGGELAVMHAVMLHDEYRPHGRPETILDLGANVGLATLFLHGLFPQARIVAVEADPETYARLERNVAHLPNVTTVHAAVGGGDEPVTFYSDPESITSSALRGAGTLPGVTVPGVSIPTLMERHGMDEVGLLKLDIEGSELAALRTAPLDRVHELFVEMHYDVVERDDDALRALLDGFELTREPGPLPELEVVHGTRPTPRPTRP
jgi:FkbM family methyltransferase